MDGGLGGFAHGDRGDVLFPASVTPQALAAAIPTPRRPLVLAPSSQRGWFGGRALVALDPVELRDGLSLAEAGAALSHAYEAQNPVLAAVLAAYDGTCVFARYEGALVSADAGWCRWGTVAADIALDPHGSPLPDPAEPLMLDARWDLSGREYRGAVEQVRERIAQGDVYVLNLTACLSGTLAVSAPSDAFAALGDRAAGDMSAYWAGLPGSVPWIASVSPERFLRVRSGQSGARVVDVCPIKGTTPRGATQDADAARTRELECDPKERAEHVMVVDLERNDLGVVCAPGTVHVDPLYEITTTPYCHQLVSLVRGTMRRDADVSELLSALFPCGSVTGAPKVAAKRIIRELERSARAAYCGALLVAVPGEIDSAVLIRTLEGDVSAPGQAHWGAGCGITHDSDSRAEYLEMLLKASPVTGDGAPEVALRETMRVTRGKAPLLDGHLARLASGGAGPGVLARVRQAVAAQLERSEAGAAYARLGVTVTPDGEVAAGLTAELSSLDVAGGPRVSMVEVSELPVLPTAAAKPASRRYWDRAHRVARARGADQAILVDGAGRLIDGSTATVWLVVEGELLTPRAPPAVAGVVRELVFDLAAQHGIVAREAELTVEDLGAADEVFLSNAVGLVVPVRGRGGAVGDVCAAALRHIFDKEPPPLARASQG